jgi:hypothetical protein
MTRETCGWCSKLSEREYFCSNYLSFLSRFLVALEEEKENE